MFNRSFRNVAAAVLLSATAAGAALAPTSASAHMGGFGGGHFGGGHFGGGHWGGGFGHWGHWGGGWGHGWGRGYYGAGYGGCWKHFNSYGELVISCY
ncbi:hypothetical protein [Methyloferula stellata]|uniref:hypothetical protein n=1 Tax=Methyloferula stellata TaxID=876270 RepID=UPI00037C2F5B|nr:hypothetical protein [Methyloferula stellata]